MVMRFVLQVFICQSCAPMPPASFLMVIPVVVSFRFCKNGKTTKQCSLSPKLFIMGAIDIMCTLTFCHFSHAISHFVSITFFINHKNSVPKLVKIWWWTGPWWFNQSAGSNCPSPWPRQGKQHRHSCQCLFSVWLIEKHSPVFFGAVPQQFVELIKTICHIFRSGSCLTRGSQNRCADLSVVSNVAVSTVMLEKPH